MSIKLSIEVNLMYKLENISKSYGNKEILKNISIEIAPGEAIGILGVNGSGKSTLLNCIAKLHPADSELKLGYVPQENPLFDELKPVDNIRMWTDFNRSQIAMALSLPPLSELGISTFLDTPVKAMSGGMKKRVSLASVLINSPNVLLLDEPFAALDLLAKQDILNYMGAFLGSGGSIIIASHEEEIFNFCHRVFLLKDGSLIDTKELANQGISYIDMLKN